METTLLFPEETPENSTSQKTLHLDCQKNSQPVSLEQKSWETTENNEQILRQYISKSFWKTEF